MNTTLIRTILGTLAGGGVLLLIVKLAGCEIDDPATAIVEATTCENSTLLASISPFATAIGTFVLIAVSGFIKTFLKSGTVKENLTAPVVPVVPPTEARPGVVTLAQVASTKP